MLYGGITFSASACVTFELIVAERGVTVTHESIRLWCRKFGAAFAQRLRRRRPRPGDTWHLDEVFIRIGGVLHYLWRAADQHGVALDILVQSAEMPPPPSASSGACCADFNTSPSASSPTACAATRLLSAPFCLAFGIAPAAIRTIALRTRIDRRDDETGRCRDLSHPARHRVSSQRTALSTATFDHVAIP